jgi:hypothetical protein
MGLFQHGAPVTEELRDTTEMGALALEVSPLLKDKICIKQVD